MYSNRKNRSYGRQRAKMLERLENLVETRDSSGSLAHNRGLQFEVTNSGVKLNIHSLLRNRHAKKIYSLSLHGIDKK